MTEHSAPHEEESPHGNAEQHQNSQRFDDAEYRGEARSRRDRRRRHHSSDNTDTGSFPMVRKRPSRSASVNAKRARIVTSVLVGLLCALLGFGYVVQVRNTSSSYESLSEDELVRVLDETSTQVDKLEQRRNELNRQLTSIQSAADKQKEAEKIAQQNAQTSGILSGRLPAEGKGVTISVSQRDKHVDAATMFTLIEELRNAGAEVISFNSARVVTSTYIKDTKNGLIVDGNQFSSPYTIKAIGNPSDLQNAIQIAGGVGSRLKVTFNASVNVVQTDSVKIDEVRQPQQYQYARTVE
ncbi:DUF881 domain-containing protein [Bifidobacterium sp.]|jgi:uncharacterized protein YlxW (UPF0749 family)|uniref:DUF881 domain-containing protein n=1 Tax=Bifidobacterium sp. TaxID=41200 RepID=UPI0025B82CFA|nr:DUF881 domain-containing protein [Bifidobacterium sp.]MCI1635719.1 DUF881 domain-containing protein [Bifidobacterium sp.]